MLARLAPKISPTRILSIAKREPLDRLSRRLPLTDQLYFQFQFDPKFFAHFCVYQFYQSDYIACLAPPWFTKNLRERWRFPLARACTFQSRRFNQASRMVARGILEHRADTRLGGLRRSAMRRVPIDSRNAIAWRACVKTNSAVGPYICLDAVSKNSSDRRIATPLRPLAYIPLLIQNLGAHQLSLTAPPCAPAFVTTAAPTVAGTPIAHSNPLQPCRAKRFASPVRMRRFRQ